MCSDLAKTSPHMGFCRNAISYDPALPVPAGSTAVKDLVKKQDNAASTMFYYHLNGLGLEAWDYQKPEEEDDCIKSIWRLVCFTYFPRSEVGCQDGSFVKYIRPCQSSCMNYVRQCNVECCDESVQCVFEHKKAITSTKMVTTEGYIPHDGPSSLCTGGAQRSARPLGVVFWAVIALMMALTLQACDYEHPGTIPVHKVGNWRGQPDYLIKNSFVPPGAQLSQSYLNSCSTNTVSQTVQCSGHGVCKQWDPADIDNKLAFCECKRDWAGPECRTRRKSQAVAFLASIFFGFLGADQFYLGFVGAGFLKLFTLGGCGVLWAMDIVRIGAAPVYTAGRYKTAADLPHYVFVLMATMYACFIGFAIAYVVTVNFRRDKRRQWLYEQIKEEKRAFLCDKEVSDRTRDMQGMNLQGAITCYNDGGGAYGTMGSMPPTMGGMPPSMGGMPPTMGGMPGSMPLNMGPVNNSMMGEMMMSDRKSVV